MNILVTGAAGFIGSHTSERLVARGHRVIGLDSFDSYLYGADVKRANAAAVAEACGDSFQLLEGDICDADRVAEALAGVDVICHLAALAGVRPSLAEPRRYIRTNLEGTTVILEAARRANIDRIVFASSSSVYGKRADAQAFREDDPCTRCASPYGATKRAGELLCSTYTDLYGLGIAALRFFTVYGPRQRPDMAIHKFVRATVTGDAVPLYGDGSSSRDYTFIDDIVSGTVGAIEGVRPGAFDIYNLGGTQTTSLAELVAVIERVTGRTLPVSRQPDQPGDVPKTFANIDRAREAFGYQPTTDIETGVARFWEWYQRAAVIASPS